MISRKHDPDRWKQEQIKYFKKYLESFSFDSREYKLIQSGIEKLEQF